MPDEVLVKRASQYADLCKITLDFATPLGHGTDGSVWKSSRRTAVKALKLKKNYDIELECYKRFRDQKVVQLQGFAVPQLISFNSVLLIIEMRIVTPPFILDFAKSWLDQPADFSEEKMQDWNEEGKERFEENWRKVKSLLYDLQKFGIYYYDAKPANIMFADTPTSE